MVEGVFNSSAPLHLESGKILEEFSLAYTTYGNLNSDGSNVIWVIHALTGDSNAADWWSGIVGEKAIYNFSNHFIVDAGVGAAPVKTFLALLNPNPFCIFFFINVEIIGILNNTFNNRLV